MLPLSGRLKGSAVARQRIVAPKCGVNPSEDEAGDVETTYIEWHHVILNAICCMVQSNIICHVSGLQLYNVMCHAISYAMVYCASQIVDDELTMEFTITFYYALLCGIVCMLLYHTM